MGKKRSKGAAALALALVCLFMSACRQGAEETDLGEQYREGSDYQYFFGASSMPVVQKVGEGCYFLLNKHLYYYDHSMSEGVPVCNKADCRHEGEDCNAYMDTDEINYYDGKFYYIAPGADEEEQWFLNFLSKDGKQREKVVQIAALDSSDRGIGFEFCVHRGYVYFSIRKGAALKKREAVVYKIRLSGEMQWEEAASFEGYGAVVEGITAYGNTLAVQGCYADTAESEFHTHTDFVDIRSGAVQHDVLFSEQSDLSLVYLKGDDVYYFDSGGLYVLDKTTGEKRRVETEGEVHVACSSDGTYIYVYNWDICREKADFREYGVSVYDMEGKRAGYIPLEEQMEWQYGDGECYFATGFDDGAYSVYRFDRAQVSGGNGVWQKILTVGGDSDGSETSAVE